MDSAAREARLTAREREPDESRCLMALLPPETKIQIMSYISTQQSLSRLGQSCRAWYGPATQELYTRDAKEHGSFAMKWMAAHAVDEQTTDSAIRTLEVSRRWGGQIDAVHRGLREWESLRGTSQSSDGDLYETSTALQFAVFLGNLRLTKTLLDMKASLRTTGSTLLLNSMGSEEVLLRFTDFQEMFEEDPFDSAFPIFLAFLQSDSDMCKLLIEHGAGREAMILGPDTNPKVMSILHFAAADRTTDYRQWQCLFHEFREHIDEPWPRRDALTPLHIALMVGCTQGMEMAVEYGADKEARDGFSRTPLSVGIKGIPHDEDSDPGTSDDRTMCFRKFVELGANVNPEGDSVLVLAVQYYAPFAFDYPLMRHLIYFLLDHHADIHGTLGPQNTNVLNEIIKTMNHIKDQDPPTQELLKELLIDLVDRGFNLTTPAPGLPSPLYLVFVNDDEIEKWLLDLLCEKGATIHEHEVDSAFRTWCQASVMWKTNEYDAWWQHQGQEDEIFRKWCEHPYNAWWWQHVKQISLQTVTEAYEIAFNRNRQLYDILTHLPLPAPPDDDRFIDVAFESEHLWSWRVVVQREYEDDLLAAFYFDEDENMIHSTVRKYHAHSCYSAADAILDVLHLRDQGVDIKEQNELTQTPLELLLRLGSPKDDYMEFVAFLDEEMRKQCGQDDDIE
ncbi:uncharacterized protein CPUR_05636 [Claviceps purpurea 20.1]|uniref:F-box domain-containing protein n=1 Tax=Claviceps purpurea (strain 20.1) TaxID=1111077 RepID=M1W2D6_CLAP2|nr:uncharacterized protein CPUR_05636 [Claviceps purpurea 20.1]